MTVSGLLENTKFSAASVKEVTRRERVRKHHPAPSGNNLGYGPIKPLAVRLNESTRAQLDIIAGLNDRTVTDEVRLAVESWIEKIKSDPTVQRRAEEVRADIERKAATKGSAAISGIPSAVRASPAMLAYFFLPPLTADNWVVPLLSMFGFGVLAGIPAALVDQLVEKWVKARRSGSAAPQR